MRLAGLLEAGLSLAKAKHELAGELAALEPAVAQQLERLLALAELYGSPTRDLLADLAGDYRRRARLSDRIRVISASPKSTARLVSWLPVGCLAAAQLLGLNPFDAIFHNLFAGASVAIGLVLLRVSHKITDRMITKAKLRVQSRAAELNSGAETALAVQAGLPIGRIESTGFETSFHKSLELANRNGIALSPLLRSQRTIEQEQFSAEVESAIERLQVTLLLPVGLLVLPALVLLAVVPTGIALLSN
jgi:tight adherence protein B